MILIDEKKVRELLPMKSCIAVMEETLKKLEEGESRMYLRSVAPLAQGKLLGLMPAQLDEQYFGAKVISVFHTNQGSGYPSHQGGILLFAAEHGEPLALVDAGSVTEIRTGAVSGLATRLLSRPESRTAAFLGAGVQARSHLLALLEVRPLTHITIWDKGAAAGERLAQMARGLGLTATVCQTVEEAVADADIISTLTPAHTPILEEEWVRPGTHINAVGACAAADRELGSQLVAKSVFYCDRVESVLHESGDYLFPAKEGLIDAGHIRGELGALLLGRCPGRQDEREITIFEALGIAVEDLAAAKYVYEQAR